MDKGQCVLAVTRSWQAEKAADRCYALGLSDQQADVCVLLFVSHPLLPSDGQ